MTTARLQRYADTIALNEEIMRHVREGYRTKVIAIRLDVTYHRVQRVARAYAGPSSPPSAS